MAAISDVEEDEDSESSEDKLLDDFKVKLQSAIANMSPAKFEQFSRALLTKMGVQFTNKGVQISNDGGIDGYGYHIDDDDFRTTRVVIQCKRFNANPVSEPDINQFLGAMNKFQADYGVFITNSRFTNKAREAAREGTPITLIDGNDLVRLVIKYELFITPVTTYVMEDFYTEEQDFINLKMKDIKYTEGEDDFIIKLKCRKFFLSHSSADKESYVRIVAKKLINNIGEEM